MKFGWFGCSLLEPATPSRLLEPETVFFLDSQQEDWSRLDAWLESVAQAISPGRSGPLPASWESQALHLPERPASQVQPDPGGWACWIGSVNRPAASRLLQWLGQHWPQAPVKLLQWTDLPIQVRVQQPERVGIDRLLNAVAANRLRRPDRPAVVVDAGTAITVDWISADGAFCGGAILPGLQMAAKALHQFTDLLPEVSFAEGSEPPPALGTYTEAAIRSGLFWGTVGAIGELIHQLAQQAAGGPEHRAARVSWQSVPDRLPGAGSPQVFLTGGDGSLLAAQLGLQDQYLPHLSLAGIALCALAKEHPNS